MAKTIRVVKSTGELLAAIPLPDEATRGNEVRLIVDVYNDATQRVEESLSIRAWINDNDTPTFTVY